MYVVNFVSIDVPSMFPKWNNATLYSLKENFQKAVGSKEKSLYDNRIASITAIWGIREDSLSTESIRWKFLDQIKKELNCKDENWAIIEVMKSGERVRLVNYLICFKAQGEALVVEYNYQQSNWIKSNTKTMELSADEMSRNMRVPFGEGKFSHDVIVTNFKGGEIINSEYFLYSTLSNQCKAVKIITGN